MRNIKLLFLGLVIILSSCNSKVNIEQSNISDIKHIDMTNIKEMPDISLLDNYITDVKLVKLETNENGLIKGITDAIITDDRIFIFDGNNIDSQIKVFDINGKFINTSTHGNGHGEITKAYRISYDSQNQTLIALQNGWLTYFDKNLNHIKDVDVEYGFTYMAIFNNEYIFKALDHQKNEFLHENSNYSIMITDTCFNLKSVALPIYRSMNSLSQALFVANDGVNIIEAYCDTIYRYANNEIVPKYIFEYKNKAFTEAPIFPEDIYKQIEYVNNLDGFTFNGKYQETDKYIYLQTHNSHDKKSQYAYYNKESGNTIGGIITLKYWMENLPIFIFPISTTKDGYFVSEFMTDWKKQHTQQILQYLSDNDKEIIQNMSDEDNPILVFYKLKDF